jgi:hypothetical protein
MQQSHSSATDATRRRPDWPAIAVQYFDGLTSIRAIATAHGNVTEAGIRRHAAAHGWGARRSTTSASSAVSTLVHALGVRLAMTDGVGDRARGFVRAMIALRASHQEIASALQISEAALVAEFASEIEGAQ